MKEEKLREAFSRIKEDFLNIRKEISEVRGQLFELNNLMKLLNEEIVSLKLEKIAENPLKTALKTSTHNTTDNFKNKTNPVTTTHNTTDPQEIEGLKAPNLGISIGNEGVPTDRQTDRQTDQQTHFSHKYPRDYHEKPIQEQISEASEILDSLDNIKKEIRRKFKKITKQEMLVFSTIYQLEEQDQEGVDYKKISRKLRLSESSIRDYTQRMINKGIPISKEKMNNKKILLHISPELKKIATLETITKLREINGFKA